MPFRLPSTSSFKLPRCLRTHSFPSLRRVPRSIQCVELVDLDQDDADYSYQREHSTWEQSSPPPPNSPASPPAHPPLELPLDLDRLDDMIDFDLGFDLGLNEPEHRLLCVGSGSAAPRAAAPSFSFATVTKTARSKFGIHANTDINRVPRPQSPLPTPRNAPTASDSAPALMSNPAHSPCWRCCSCGRINLPSTTSTTAITDFWKTDADLTNATQTEQAARMCPCGHSLEPCLLKARLRKLRDIQRRGGGLGVAFVRA